MRLTSASGPSDRGGRQPRAASKKVLLASVVCGSAVVAMTIVGAAQQPEPQAPQGRGGRGGGRGGASPALFAAADSNKDGTLTRSEFTSTLDAWFTKWDASGSGSLTQDQMTAGLTAALQPA